jgi:hypothetical protein
MPELLLEQFDQGRQYPLLHSWHLLPKLDRHHQQSRPHQVTHQEFDSKLQLDQLAAGPLLRIQL